MLPGYEPGTEKRCELLRYCLNEGLEISTISRITDPLDGKTEEEKESIAEKLLKQIMSDGIENLLGKKMT